MAEEQVDVVNEHNETLYSVPKSTAHKEGLLHRTVIAEYINSKGEWTLIKQAANKQDAGRYVSPMGGHVATGETEEEAMRREVKEELGVEVRKFKLIGKIIYRRDVGEKDENHYFIIYETYGDEEPTLNHESVDFRRFTEEQLKTALKETPELFGAAFHFLVEKIYPRLLR